ncbi:MAG TPA: ABC transporter substrate-binding protein, partial [Acidimicrobiales bacterium]
MRILFHAALGKAMGEVRFGGRPVRARWAMAVVAACIIVAACGARVPDQLRQQAASAALNAGGTGGASQSVGGGPGASPSGPGGANPTAGGSTAETALGSEGVGGAPIVGGTGTGSTGGGAGANAVAPPAPAGGNGGATDVGVTATSILAGNVSDLTGPVPGIFEGAVLGTKAYFDYVNSQGGVFGRQLTLDSADGQTDCNATQSATQGLTNKVFAYVGSFEIYDDCMSNVLGHYPGISDVSYPLSIQHKKLSTNFSVAPSPPGYPTGMFEYFKSKYGTTAIHNVGVLYSNVPAATFSYRSISAAALAAGWKITYSRGFAATESNFTTDVVRMRQQGVQVFWSTFLTAAQAATVVQEEQSQSW